jgi:mRNA interferase RelE/StbE
VVGTDARSFRISRKADKFIHGLPDRKREAVKKAVKLLIKNETETLDIKKLLPYPKEYRLRVDDIRILFHATDEELFIFKAGYRGQVYRKG